MSAKPTCPNDVELQKRLLLDMARERSVERVLQLVVDRMASQPEIALARIWLVAPGDICAECRMRDDCADRTACLHLVASAGRSAETGEVWGRIDGAFRRFPFGVRKIGKIASTGEPIEVPDIAEHPEVLARPEWARAEGIRAAIKQVGDPFYKAVAGSNPGASGPRKATY